MTFIIDLFIYSLSYIDKVDIYLGENYKYFRKNLVKLMLQYCFFVEIWWSVYGYQVRE